MGTILMIGVSRNGNACKLDYKRFSTREENLREMGSIYISGYTRWIRDQTAKTSTWFHPFTVAFLIYNHVSWILYRIRGLL